jgi:hypothetical protein
LVIFDYLRHDRRAVVFVTVQFVKVVAMMAVEGTDALDFVLVVATVGEMVWAATAASPISAACPRRPGSTIPPVIRSSTSQRPRT